MRNILVFVILCALAAGCSGSSSEELSELRRPGAPQTYWLGESFDGFTLQTTDAGTGRPDFIYGTCEAGSDSGCAPPLELQQWALLERPPTAFEAAPGRPAACRRVAAGELTAARFATTGGVEVYLGDRVVVVFTGPDRLGKVLEELRPVKDQDPALPPPPAWVAKALERCKPPLS